MSRLKAVFLAVILFSAIAFIGVNADAAQGDTTRVSVDSSGAQGNSSSRTPSISADGRYVAFASNADNLVLGDTNGSDDVFVHDTQTGSTTRVSIDSEGAEGNNDSYEPSISADGRYVAFTSYADNLVLGDTNGYSDIFVHDTQTGITTRVSIDSSGAQGNSSSYEPSISADGRYVAFTSYADNLVLGDTNGYSDIFVHDTQTGATTRVSIDSSGIQGNDNSEEPSISSDGRYVAFSSPAGNLVAGDTNGWLDVFVHDAQTGTTTRVSIDSSGIQGNDNSYEPSISSDGRYVAFSSYAGNLVAGDTNNRYDVFVHDTQTGATTLVSIDSSGAQGNNSSSEPSISADGRYVAFRSYASNLVAGDTNGYSDVFVHDTQTGTTRRVSIDSSGVQGDDNSRIPSISSDGRYVAFSSPAGNLVAGDTNSNYDIFVHELLGVAAIINTINTIQGGGGCFIATAAYGSYFEPHVEVLRDFRDSVLLTNKLGKVFVNFYYNTSPPIADYIAKHESMKMATRWALTPLVYGIKYPGVAVMTLLGLVLIPVLRRRKTAKKVLPLLLLSLLVFAPMANAFDAHIINPKVGEERFVNIESTRSISQGKTKLGVFLDYAQDPVGAANNINLSDHQFVATASAGYGISDALQVSISVPYLFDQRGRKIDGIADASSSEFGDITLSGKYRIADNKSNRLGLGFAVSPYLVIDTGASDDWFGSGTFYGGARLIVDKEIDSATRAAINIGYQIKETEVLTATQEIGDTISYGLGISHDINNDLFVTGEAYVSTPASDAFNDDLTPMEADVSLGYNVMPDVQLILGAGAGSEGIGAPNWRILTGVRAAL